MPNTNSEIISAVKDWVSPMLIAIVGTLLWSDLSELKNDVKMLLIQQSENATRIQMLERDVDILKQKTTVNYSPSASVAVIAISLTKRNTIPVWMRIGPFKKEDEIDLESYSLA